MPWFIVTVDNVTPDFNGTQPRSNGTETEDKCLCDSAPVSGCECHIEIDKYFLTELKRQITLTTIYSLSLMSHVPMADVCSEARSVLSFLFESTLRL